jgi:hypothetical protein
MPAMPGGNYNVRNTRNLQDQGTFAGSEGSGGTKGSTRLLEARRIEGRHDNHIQESGLMSQKGIMGIPSKPAHRTGRYAPTSREAVARARVLAAELEKFCDEPFPNGATITEWNGVDGGMNPDHTTQRCIS